MAVRFGHMELDCILADGLDRAEGGIETTIDRAGLLIEHTVKARGDGLRVQRVAVAEGLAGLDLDGENLAVRRKGRVGGEVLLDVVLRIEPVEPFQHGEIDRIADRQVIEGGIEGRRIGADGDAQHPSRLSEGLKAEERDARGQRRRGARMTKAGHVCCSPSWQFRRSAQARWSARTLHRRHGAKSVSGFLAACSAPCRNAGGDGDAEQITAFDLPQIHKFTIYMN